MKRMIIIALSALLALSGLAGCAGKEDKLKIGILQYAPHASLDDCYTGIIAGLKEAGYRDGDNCVIDYENAQGESETDNLIAANFVSGNYDIIIAIATPAAVAAYAAARPAGIPVVFSAVSDPLGAGLAESLEKPGNNCTGTSDNLNYGAQLALIRAFQPTARKIGILYTTSEANSLAQLKQYQDLAGDYGFTIVAQGITDASEVAAGAAYLVSAGVDCLNNLTDNTVVNNFSIVTAATDPAGIPCYGSEIQQVAEYGCVAAESLDYVELGRETGNMAAKVLGGRDPSSLPIQIVAESFPCYSSANLKKFGLTLPDDCANAKDTAKQ